MLPLKDISTAEFSAWFDGIDHVLFDCDGVIWNGDKGLVPGAKELLVQLRRHKRPFWFVTNSASATRAGYAAKFAKLMEGDGNPLDPPVQPSEIMCTAYATALRLQRTVGVDRPHAKDIYVIGTAGLAEEIQRAGFTPHGLEDSASAAGGAWTGELKAADMLPSERVAAVVIGIDRQISYLKMTSAVVYLRRGGGSSEEERCRFVATNVDRVVPINDQLVASNGMVVTGVAYAAGREPDDVVGKPSTTMIDLLAEHQSAGGGMGDRGRAVMVGDNLDTDILFGIAAGTQTLLVTKSGVSDAAAAAARPSHQQPGAVADSVAVIASRLKDMAVTR